MSGPLIERFALTSVLAALEDTPVVAVNGARQVGKSTLMSEVAHRRDDVELVTLDDAAQRRAATEDPDGFVERRAKTLIVDEVQLVPALMRSIKAAVDRDRRPGRFVLTGSTRLLATPGMTESLAGRMEIIELWPLSRAETLGSSGDFVDRAFAGLDAVSCRSELTKDDYLDLVCLGGFPEPLGRAASRRRQWFDSYAGAVIERVVNEIADVRRAGEIPQLFRLCAARSGQEVNVAAMGNELGIPARTASAYLAHLVTVFAVQLIPAWATNVSAKVIRKPKLLVVDSGLAASVLRQDASTMRHPDAPTGQLVETFALMEIRKLLGSSAAAPSMYHYRDRQGLEVDCVLEGPGGSLVGIEIKAGSSVGSSDFKGLRFLADRFGDRLAAGVVLYTGRDTVPFGPRLAAVPMSALWQL